MAIIPSMESRICKSCQNTFVVEDEDLLFYEKLQVPAPDYCPDCREQRRLVFRNDRHYYARTCDLCKKNIISLYDPKRIKNVYCIHCWWSDNWDPVQYGRDFDFNKPFFKQYRELLDEVPKVAMMNDDGVASINCEYTTDFAFGKNCYLVLSSWYDEDCMFGYQLNRCKNCIDNTFVNGSQFMYDCAACENSYGCQGCMQCSECTNCLLSYDLKNCNECILSIGLRNKSYCIWNEQYSKEEYFQKKKELGLDTWSNREGYRENFSEFSLSFPRKYANLINCEECIGNNLVNSKNAKLCFNFWGLKDCKYMTSGDVGKDSQDCYCTGNTELCYDCITSDNSYFERFSINCWKSQYTTYCDNCHSCQNLFGCVNMKRKQYCILNKQYTKEEYEALVPRIIEHMKNDMEWGNFFAPEVTLFAYNETAAQEWYPLTTEKAKELGYSWINQEKANNGKETMKWEEVPESIDECTQKMTQEIFACIKCAKNYKITSQEFVFYKANSIPLPRLCDDCRYLRRKARMNPQKIWQRTCMKCGTQIASTYAPDRPEIVYCEECYLESVY